MTKTKSRQSFDVCGDCGTSDPSWASVNRGILLCIECCSIHRSLGRHVSQVKSLQKSCWYPSQHNMVKALNNSGANNIWEYSLESNPKVARRKPGPKDPLNVKSEFIRAKHQQHAFAFCPNNEDGPLCVENELGKQLHASVRSTNVDTSFRLLLQGANPNYFHDEKCSMPLHVAAKANQLLQAELLITYGADPACPDAQGKTAIDYARQQVNQELANRLVEHQYEVTDKFSFYLCHRKPEHEKGVHFLIPQSSTRSDVNALAKLKKLPNRLFEELAMDVYDEVDRRETEAIWLSSAETLDLNANAVPFLPVDSSLSPTRNQGRQKLGRFTTPELKGLVYDILTDAQRRQSSADKATDASGLRQYSQISDDEPLYDSVASDDDYAVLANDNKPNSPPPLKEEAKEHKSVPDETLQLLTQKLHDSDSTISSLKAEVSNLRVLVEHLSSENHELKSRLSQSGVRGLFKDEAISSSLNGLPTHAEDEQKAVVNGIQSRRSQRPSSMYETREGLKVPNWQMLKNQIKQNEYHRPATTQSLYAGPRRHIVMQYTEHVTEGIKQLWRCIQGTSARDECVQCADRIRIAVTNLTTAITNDGGKDVIKRLHESSTRLCNECSDLRTAHKSDNVQQTDYYLQQVRLCAYEIAKDTKLLVTSYSSH